MVVAVIESLSASVLKVDFYRRAWCLTWGKRWEWRRRRNWGEGAGVVGGGGREEEDGVEKGEGGEGSVANFHWRSFSAKKNMYRWPKSQNLSAEQL